MLASELINELIPPLKLSDSAGKALKWMDEFRVHQLPVVENLQYLGMLSDDELYDAEDSNQKISEFEPDFEDVFVAANKHFYEVVKIANDNNLQTIVVLDENKKYKGLITLRDTLLALSRTCATQSPGGIIVLMMPQRDYSLSHISRLIESDNAKILSLYIEPDTIEIGTIRVTLKLDKTDLSHIIATLERFSYKVIAKFQDTDKITNERERLDMLFRFLEI